MLHWVGMEVYAMHSQLNTNDSESGKQPSRKYFKWNQIDCECSYSNIGLNTTVLLLSKMTRCHGIM